MWNTPCTVVGREHCRPLDHLPGYRLSFRRLPFPPVQAGVLVPRIRESDLCLVVLAGLCRIDAKPIQDIRAFTDLIFAGL